MALWVAMTPYAGLSHDAQAYAFQSLARLDPSTLGQDVFLRFESQDRFTIFPALYARAIDAFGLEPAAGALTLGCHLAWFGAAFLLVRRLLGPVLAALAVGLLVTIPGPYGGLRVFHFAEPFLTARLPAEALSLLGLWLWFGGRRGLAAACVALAMLLHPLMAFPAILVCTLLLADNYRTAHSTVPVVTVALVAGAVLAAVVLGGSGKTLDPAWIEAARSRSNYLFPTAWRAADWNHTILSIVTLVIATQVLRQSPARAFGRATLWIGLAGLALAIISAEVWNLKLLLQGQPWRWLWLTRFAAIALLPAVIGDAWQQGSHGRAAALLLVAAWAFVLPVSQAGAALTLSGSALAILAWVVVRFGTSLPERERAVLLRGSALVLAIVLLAAAITASLVAVMARADSDVAQWKQGLQSVLFLITPAAVLATVAWQCWRSGRRAWQILASLGAVAFLLVAGPEAARRWTEQSYGPAQQAIFATWRARISPQSEVFWGDGLREVWFLLHRRSYLTISQGGGLVFSGDTVSLLRRRAHNLAVFIDPGFWLREPQALLARPNPLSEQSLATACRGDAELGFVVSRDRLPELAVDEAEWPEPGHRVYLYDCSPYREAATR